MAARPAVARSARRALRVAAWIAVVLGALHWWGVGLKLLLMAAIVIAAVAWALPWIGVRWPDRQHSISSSAYGLRAIRLRAYLGLLKSR